MKLIEWLTNPIMMMILGILSGIAIIAVMLYLDKKQEDEIEKIKSQMEWNYQAIIVLARIVKTQQEGFYDPENFYDEVINDY